ncbi:hypothetical protein FHU14_004947 [Mesorhizobium sp. RMAD-H1]|nr:hypothetical protein [Mesorhizobium sp. RMAD-H1]
MEGTWILAFVIVPVLVVVVAYIAVVRHEGRDRDD